MATIEICKLCWVQSERGGPSWYPGLIFSTCGWEWQMRSCLYSSGVFWVTMVTVRVRVIRFVCFSAHLWLNFDLQAAAEPAGLLQRWPCNPTHRLQDPLSHLLHDEVTINISTVSRMHSLDISITNIAIYQAANLQISCVLLIVQVGEPIDEVIENAAREKSLMNIIFFKRKLLMKCAGQ